MCQRSATWILVPIIAATIEIAPPPVKADANQMETRPAALGTLEARDRQGQLQPLALVAARVQVRPVGDFAETRIEHVFRNDTDQRLEGKFRFPLPEGALVVGLAMDINGQLEEGELLEREQARRTYQAIVDSMRDPAILEWDGGQRFDLRVFPIEPLSDKRVVLTFIAPLSREGEQFRYVFPLAGGSARLPAFRLDFDRKSIIDAVDFEPDRDVMIDLLPGRLPAAVLKQTRTDGTYAAVRIRPDWSRIPTPPPTTRRHVVVLFDVSRSMLESRDLAMETLEALLMSLGPNDRFRLVAVDLDQREAAPDFVVASPAKTAEVLAFVRGIEAEGASDLGGALAHGGRILQGLAEADRRNSQIVYIGDGKATWGETDPAKLVEQARTSLAGASLFAFTLGRNPETRLLRELTQAVGGRVETPREIKQVQRFASWLRAAQPELTGVTIDDAEILDLYPRETMTLFRGDEVTALLRIPADRPAPDAIVLRGETAQGPFVQRVPLSPSAETEHVARRWAAREIERLEAESAPREKVVAVSLDFRVLCRHTAFLVLEPQEKRRREAEADERAGDPAVSGRDLETLDSEASLTPDRIQPGDPEIRVTAPANARSVVIVLPTGETKMARFEASTHAWTARFLIDATMPPGRHPAFVRITHHDGRIETLRVFLTVDTEAPWLELTLHPSAKKPGSYEIIAIQKVAPAETFTGPAGSQAEVRPDARRVEVGTPDGKVVALALVRDGLFRGYWTPRLPLTGPVTLRVVAIDRALNRRVSEVTLDPAGTQRASNR